MTSIDQRDDIPPATRKVLAVDYGTKAIGLASYSPGRDPCPLPYTRLSYRSDEALIQDLLDIVKEETIAVVVLGVPRLLDGRETAMTRRILDFGEKLESALQPIPLYRQDESLSTFEAEERMKNSPRYNFKVDLRHIDALAATIILEDFVKKNG
jgi:putative holliday junction resolvase